MGFDLTAVRCALLTLGLSGALRLNADRTLYKTDNGNPIIDAPLPREVDMTQLGSVLDGTPGIVGHGFF
jgi:ribose 5-phosphate isomerase